MSNGQRTSDTAEQVRGAAPPARAGQPAHGLRKRRYGWAIALALLLAAAVPGGWLALHRTPAVHYLTAPVTKGAVTRTVSATGTVNPELTIIVGTYVSGVIQQLYCDYNTQVKQGQVCAKIDPRPYQATVDQDKANLAVAKAQLEKDKAQLAYAEVAHQRNAGLARSASTPRRTPPTAPRAPTSRPRRRSRSTRPRSSSARRSCSAAQVNLGYTNIVSPVDGTVVSRNVTMGQTVAAQLPDPDAVPDRHRPDQDAGRHQCQRERHRQHQGRRQGHVHGRRLSRTACSRARVTQVRQSPQTVQNVVTYDVVVSARQRRSGAEARHDRLGADRHRPARQRDARAGPGVALLRRRPRRPAAGGRARPRIWVLRNGKPAAVPVDAGLDDDSFTEIVSGDVKPGDGSITGEQREHRRPAPRRRACRDCDRATPCPSPSSQSRTSPAPSNRRGGRAGAARRQPDRRAGRIRRHHGLVRLRQIDADVDPWLPRPAEQRPLFLRGRRRRAAAASRSWRRIRSERLGFVFQSFNLLGAHQRDRERRAAAVLCPARPGPPAPPVSPARATRWRCSAWPSASATRRASCPAASSSASPSPAR